MLSTFINIFRFYRCIYFVNTFLSTSEAAIDICAVITFHLSHSSLMMFYIYLILKLATDGDVILTILQKEIENLTANAEPACPLVPFEEV